jgi:two-component system chemotaxis response regulator CheB
VSEFTAESDSRFRIVVGGVSLGGLEAMRAVLAGLPPGFPLPVAFVAHRGEEPDDTLSPLLQPGASLRVKEAEDKERILPGCFYLAPRAYHLMVDGDRFALSVDAPVMNARPSIDVLFESAAEACGPGAIGVVLTGASADGAAGATRIEQRGGLVVVQEPSTALASAMPLGAIAATNLEHIMPLERIAPFLCRLCGCPGIAGAMPTRVVGMRSAQEGQHMPTTSVGMAPDVAPDTNTSSQRHAT